MRIRQSAALLGAALLLAACSNTGSGTAALDTADQKASYGIGLDMGRQLEPAKSRLDLPAFRKGVEDALAGAEQAIPNEDIQVAMEEFNRAVMQEQREAASAASEKNVAEGTAYLAENGKKEGVITTESGLQYEVLVMGDGPKPTAEDQVKVHYHGMLIDGKVFDSSVDRGEPLVFGVGGVIKGFAEALQLMPVGSKFRIVIPSDLAYGGSGAGGDIGPNATLIFELELLEIVQ